VTKPTKDELRAMLIENNQVWFAERETQWGDTLYGGEVVAQRYDGDGTLLDERVVGEIPDGFRSTTNGHLDDGLSVRFSGSP
jgi:hypothetical protein